MPQPTVSQVHLNAMLTNISVAYIQDASRFIASKVFPVVPVEKKSDAYHVYTKNDWFRDEAKVRADATESAGSGYNIGEDTYNCEVYALHKDVGNQARANADKDINLDRDATQFVTQRLLVRQEVQWAADYFVTGIWGTSFTPANLWDDYTNGDPIDDVETAKSTILSNTGFLPNTLVLGYEVFRYLKHHPDIVDRIKYTSSETVTTEILAALFELERVMVCHAVYATNLEGAAGAYSFVQGDHALLAYVNPTPGLLAPSAGYMFNWNGVSGGLGENIGISKFYMDEKKADRVEGEVAWDDKLVATDLGYFFEQVVT